MARSKRETPYHRQQIATAESRRARIKKLVEGGYSYTQIGAMFVPKISRQRVGQIYREVRERETAE